MFPKPAPKIHQSFEDPDGKDFDAFIQTYDDIEKILLPQIHITLGL
jgi:arsenate reductase